MEGKGRGDSGARRRDERERREERGELTLPARDGAEAVREVNVRTRVRGP